MLSPSRQTKPAQWKLYDDGLMWLLPLDPKTMKNEGFTPPTYGLKGCGCPWYWYVYHEYKWQLRFPGCRCENHMIVSSSKLTNLITCCICVVTSNGLLVSSAGMFGQWRLCKVTWQSRKTWRWNFVNCRRMGMRLQGIQVHDYNIIDLPQPVHPGKLTWNPKTEVWKIIFLFNWVIF